MIKKEKSHLPKLLNKLIYLTWVKICKLNIHVNHCSWILVYYQIINMIDTLKVIELYYDIVDTTK